MPNLVGIGNSQVPTNAMLGGLAYQDPAHANLTEVEIEKIAAIKAKLRETATDIFVYDTRKDSDGGAWRKRTKHTSWYNESPSQQRGPRKEFPAVAILVVRDVNPAYGLTIYDGDDPDLSMWMDYPKDTTQDPFLDYTDNGSTHMGNYSPTSVSALNGIICVGTWRSAGILSNLNAGLREFHFIEDECYATNNDKRVKFPTRIADRSAPTPKYFQVGLTNIKSSNVNDVAMTVLPNAPIDPATGLPIPTIGVATAEGTSVIKDDGSIVDITSGTIIHHEPRNIAFLGTRLLWTEGNNYDLQDRVFLNAPIPIEDIQLSHAGALPSDYIGYGLGGGATNIHNNLALFTPMNNEPATRARKFQISGSNNTIVLGCNHSYNGGIEQIHQNIPSPLNGMIVAASSSYNSGWMHGDCRGAYLADTDTTDATPTNLITNGDFASNTSGWTGSNANLSVVSNRMKILTTANNGYAYQAITTVVGKQYVLTFYISTDGNASVWVRIGDSAAGTTIINANPIGEGKNVGFTFIATATTTYITFMVSTTGTNKDIHIDNVKVILAEEDRSKSADGLDVTGTVPKQVVATGADLVSYGPFSSSNFLHQPINNSSYSQYSNLRNFGTNAMYYMTWLYCTSHSAVQVIAALWNGQNSSDVRTAWYINASDGKLSLYEQNGGSNSAQGTHAIRLNAWNHCVTIRGKDYIRAYVNGKEYMSNFTAIDISQNDMALMVGGDRWDNGTSPASSASHTKLALLRIGAGAPTAEQVRKIYDDEKKLFVPNAKCTLYGSSDAVTAIAYDDSNDTIHAATSAGRSEFSGLIRINNTTTAVTTALSVSNGLVAEQ